MTLLEVFKSNKKPLFLLIFLFVFPFIFDSLILSYIITNENHFQSFSNGQWNIFYLITTFAMAFGFTHTTFIAIFSGYFLGWLSVLYVVISYLMASLIGYMTGTWINGGKFIQGIYELPQAGPIAKELKKNEFAIVLLSRLSPALPFAVTNILLALLKANFIKYFIGGAIGMLPRTLLFIWTGTQAKDLAEVLMHPENLSISRIFTVLFLILSISGLFYYVSRAIKKGLTDS